VRLNFKTFLRMISESITLLFCLLLLNFNLSNAQYSEDEDPCFGVRCSNKGLCVPNEIYSRGYWCECDQGWAGQDCKHPEPTVQCGDRRIDVVIDRGLVQELGIEDDVDFVFFGRSTANSQCRATEEDNLYKLSINAPFTNCGTQIAQQQAGDDYTFSNTVVWNREVNNTHNLIDRELILLDFKCIYEDTYTVSGPSITPTINVIKFANEKGQFEVSMTLFRDSYYRKQYSPSPTIMVGSYIYVQVELAHLQGADLVVTLDRCFASQSGDPADPTSTKHMLIDDRCVNSNDTTIAIKQNGKSEISQFKFQMFKWRFSADDVYIHCEVDICSKTNEMCSGNGIDCNGDSFFRMRRSVSSREGVFDPDLNGPIGHVVSQGPIQVTIDESNHRSWDLDDEIDDQSVMILIGGVVLVVILLGIIGGVIGRRKWKQKQATADKEAEEVTRKNLTSLNFTRESF